MEMSKGVDGEYLFDTFLDFISIAEAKFPLTESLLLFPRIDSLVLELSNLDEFNFLADALFDDVIFDDVMLQLGRMSESSSILEVLLQSLESL